MQNIGGLCALSPTGLSTPDTGGEPGLGPERKENPTCTESGARAQGEESGMSNIQLNFTFNRLTTSPPVPLHTSSLRSCSKFAKTFLISISILAVNKVMLWHMFHQLAPSESSTLISERRSVRSMRWSRARERRVQEGNVMRTFLQNVMNVMTWPLSYKIQPILNTALAQLITSAMPWPFLTV